MLFKGSAASGKTCKQGTQGSRQTGSTQQQFVSTLHIRGLRRSGSACQHFWVCCCKQLRQEKRVPACCAVLSHALLTMPRRRGSRGMVC